jgi:SEC-C motif-containing protein
MNPVDPRRCPCGLGEPYAACCGRLHRGEVKAASAELLMRSRFSAFAVGAADYLQSSWHPATRPANLSLDPELRWIRLEIISTSAGGFLDAEGTVRFRAHYEDQGRRGCLDELSRFTRLAGSWVYLDGESFVLATSRPSQTRRG